MSALFVVGLGIYLLGTALPSVNVPSPTGAIFMIVGAILILVSPFIGGLS